jgi:hypothetical protein
MQRSNIISCVIPCHGEYANEGDSREAKAFEIRAKLEKRRPRRDREPSGTLGTAWSQNFGDFRWF